MRRLPLVAAAAVLLAVTGCGATQTSPGGVPDPDPKAAASRSAHAEQALKDAEERARQVTAEHDRTWPEVAKACAGVTGSPSPAGSVSLDPEAAKYAENHMYKQTVALDLATKCRGDAHAARIRTALAGRADSPAGVEAALVSLGYPKEAIKVVAYPSGPGAFTLEVPGAGPCIEGRPAGSGVSVEAHGYYQEGGCTEPKGGH